MERFEALMAKHNGSLGLVVNELIERINELEIRVGISDDPKQDAAANVTDNTDD